MIYQMQYSSVPVSYYMVAFLYYQRGLNVDRISNEEIINVTTFQRVERNIKISHNFNGLFQTHEKNFQNL